jgi:hypothetical protein
MHKKNEKEYVNKGFEADVDVVEGLILVGLCASREGPLRWIDHPESTQWQSIFSFPSSYSSPRGGNRPTAALLNTLPQGGFRFSVTLANVLLHS